MNTTKLPGTEIEIINSEAELGKFKHVLFDFDGTVSLLREGWQLVMAPLMEEMICGDTKPTPEIKEKILDYIEDSTGIQTILQMEKLEEMIREHGFVPEDKILDAHGYKAIYNERLMVCVEKRIEQLKNGELKPEDVTLRGALDFLRLMSAEDITMYIFSGTDRDDVKNEAGLVGTAPYFQEIWGALRTYKDYNKEMVLRDIIAKNDLHGSEVLIIGDGPVEIRNAKANGCVSIGVASNEVEGHGWNMEKYDRLVEAGADIMIADFSDYQALVKHLFPA